MSGPRRGVSWDAFLQVRELDRRAALAVALDYAQGDLDAARPLLDTWRFGGDGALTGTILQHLLAQPPSPSGAELNVHLEPGEALPRNGRLLAPWQHRHWLAAQSLTPRVRPGREPRLAWGLMELRALGRDIEDRSRAPWLRQPVGPDTADDEMASLWRSVSGQGRWSSMVRWQTLFAPSALAAVRAVLDACGWPRADWRARLDYEEENFGLRLLGRGPDAGWRVLAARVIETGPSAPLTELARCLDEAAWSSVARCAVRRGHGWTTASRLWPEVGRARILTERMSSFAAAAPGQLEALAELHLASRLVVRWAAGQHIGPADSWRIVSQNLGRARGRLRAVLRRLPDDALRDAVLERDHLHARTRLAVLRMWRDIAWTELHGGFSGDLSLDVEAVCDVDRVEREDEAPESLLRTWVLLVILRGRGLHLTRWVGKGATGDRDATWGRLLTKDMPPALRPGRVPIEGLNALRARLLARLSHLLGELRAVVTAVAALDPTQQGLPQALSLVLAPVWDTTVRLPAARHREIVAHAVAALHTLYPEEAGP